MARGVLARGGSLLSDLWAAIGLTASEADAYDALVQSGPQAASALAKATRQSRGRIYLILRSLVERGFVREEPGEPTTFSAVPPREVIGMAALAAHRRAGELEALLPELASTPVPTPAPPRAKAAGRASLLRGRRAVASETLRVLDRSRNRFYLAGAGSLALRAKAWGAFLRAARARAHEGVRVAIAVTAPAGSADVADFLPEAKPAFVARLAGPEGFPLTLVVGDSEAILVLVEPEDGAPLDGDDVGIHLRGQRYADAFSVWFQRVALGATTSLSPQAMVDVQAARAELSAAIESARTEVVAIASGAWLKVLFASEGARSSGGSASRGVRLRLVTEADPKAWRFVQPRLADWETRMVRSVPVWAVVVDGSLTFVGLPGDDRDQLASVRKSTEPSDARQHLERFEELWRSGTILVPPDHG